MLNLRPDAEAVNPTRVKDATWTVALPNGDRYQGDWDASGDLRHGSGRCEYASGDVYDGRWSSDAVHIYLWDGQEAAESLVDDMTSRDYMLGTRAHEQRRKAAQEGITRALLAQRPPLYGAA